MKSLFTILMMLIFSVVNISGVSAKVGDMKGSALHTDIIAYINHYAISSYAVNGQSCIVAEDLRNYGFDVQWDETERSLSITRNCEVSVIEQSISKAGESGSFFANTLETDISVFADGIPLTSYAINGYTMIPVEELTCFGEVYWVESERALKLWIEGLQIRNVAQPVTPYTTPVSTTSSYSSTTDDTPSYSSTVYVTPTGKRYHYSSSCAGKNGRAVNINKATSSGYTACKKCV